MNWDRHPAAPQDFGCNVNLFGAIPFFHNLSPLFLLQNPQYHQYMRLSPFFWLMAYLVFLVGLVLLMLQLRTSTLASLDNAGAREDWQQWKADAAKTPQYRNPVARRPPQSDEPPALILMRDHFAVMLTGAVLFGSLLLGVLMVAVRGSLSRGRPAASHAGRQRTNGHV